MRYGIELLADRPECIETVAQLRWREWGHPPEPTDLDFWVDTTTREAGRDSLPITFVAVDAAGTALGVVGMDEYDVDERHDVSPWVTGTIVRRDLRGHGIGQALMTRLETWAADSGIGQAWVATASAEAFYRRCGWVAESEADSAAQGRRLIVLAKRLDPLVSG